MTEEQKTEFTQNPFLKSLVEKYIKPKQVCFFYHYFDPSDALNHPLKLVEILGISKERLSQTAQNILKIMEEEEPQSDIKDRYKDFEWKLTAFTYLQDVFDSQLFPSKSILNIFHIWYFYYESKYVLIELIMCWLNGFYNAANQLLRLFIEFNLLQNYYYRLIHKEQSFNSLERYFKTKKHPSWNTILKNCVPNDNFTKPIKKRIDMHLKGLSQTASHPYHPDLSPKHHSSFIPEPSLEGVYFWENIKLIMEAILWVYYVNFPMLFHPVDSLKKFGFNGPVGLFIDKVTYHIIKKSLLPDDYQLFFDYSLKNEKVTPLLDYYNSFPDMTEEEILNTWKKEKSPIKSLIEGFCISKAELRGIRETFALIPLQDQLGEQDVEKIEKYEKLFRFHEWKKVYKKFNTS